MNGLNPISAVTVTDPYPYYAHLIAERPFHLDSALHMWVAASAEAVEAVLSDAAMRVRPPMEPVPASIVDTPIAQVFARWVRMRDGRQHAAAKNSVTAALTSSESFDLPAISEHCADLLAQTLSGDEIGLASYVTGLPVLAVATALGLPHDASSCVAWTKDLVRSIAPSSTQDDIGRGVAATDALTATMRALLAEGPPVGSLFSAFVEEARRHGIDDDVIIANSLGFLFQSYDAAAGLIGNTLVALARSAPLRDRVHKDVRFLEGVIDEVARYDAPVQNTRRFAAADTTVMGSRVREGDCVLVLLAAANRDASVNPDPHRFDARRKNRRTYTFGMGAHACPGARVAATIARAGVARLLKTGIDFGPLSAPTYRPSANARVVDFTAPAAATGASRAE